MLIQSGADCHFINFIKGFANIKGSKRFYFFNFVLLKTAKQVATHRTR